MTQGQALTCTRTSQLASVKFGLTVAVRAPGMTMGTLIPYGNSLWFRLLLGWLLPPQMSFLKSSHTAETREASIRKQVSVDLSSFPLAGQFKAAN